VYFYLAWLLDITGGKEMKEIEKAKKEIKKLLVEAEKNNEPFHWLVDKLGMVRLYGIGLPIHIVLGIIEEWTEDIEERKRVKALEGFDEEHAQKAYVNVQSKWDQRNN
jgi:hypothetical protein